MQKQPFFEDDEDMEMPCVCDCGRVFDLHYGENDPYGNQVVCRKCGEAKQKRYDLEQEIDACEYDIQCENIGKREGKKKLKTLRQQLFKLED